jgi:hypothetical protein
MKFIFNNEPEKKKKVRMKADLSRFVLQLVQHFALVSFLVLEKREGFVHGHVLDGAYDVLALFVVGFGQDLFILEKEDKVALLKYPSGPSPHTIHVPSLRQIQSKVQWTSN